jgi:Large eukaryotic DNA virus major capsid protein/Major capsid protein N-terminus
LALPLIALQYHEVRICLEFRNKEECYVACDEGDCTLCVGSLEYASLFVDYIYLDTDERRRFAQVSHEYLIEQLQFTGDESTTNVNVKVKLNFNHPVKELIWVVQREDFCCRGINQWNNYTDNFDSDCCETTPGCQTDSCSSCGSNGVCILNTNVDTAYGGRTTFPQGPGQAQSVCLSCYERCDQDGSGAHRSMPQGPGGDGCGPVNFGSINVGYGGGGDHALYPLNAGRNPVVRAKLQLNGHDRFQERLGSYFNLVQPYQHHTNIPSTGINVYSFALKPEEHQPSGTCNFSRIDNACLQMQLTPLAVKGAGARIRIYATNYNVLRIMSGMGGLAYSN